jgi:hypothetical protein
MTERRKMDLKNSIENSANFVSANMGAETVVGILKMHNAESIDDLCVSDYEEVFSTLFQYEADCKD